MYDFEIFADSSANVPENLVKKYGLNIIPYTYNVEGVEKPCYVAGQEFSAVAKEFYAKMREGLDVKTSLVDEQRFFDAISPVLESGRDAVVITITEGLSGTKAQALKAKAALEEKYAGRKVYVCDAANASLGQGLLVLKCAEMRESGMDAKTCAKWVEDNAYCVHSYVTVGDLKYLRKSGRVSLVAAVAGTILNIKPILWANSTTPAKLTVCSKERGRKKALNALLEGFKQNVKDVEDQTVAIAHADCEEDALFLESAVKELGAKNVIIDYYDLCTGAHAGPDTIALFFFGEDRRKTQK